MGTTSSASKEVIREMAHNKFIDDVAFWLKAIDQRNLSAQTYNERLANEVYEFARSFLSPAQNFLAYLKTK